MVIINHHRHINTFDKTLKMKLSVSIFPDKTKQYTPYIVISENNMAKLGGKICKMITNDKIEYLVNVATLPNLSDEYIYMTMIHRNVYKFELGYQVTIEKYELPIPNIIEVSLQLDTQLKQLELNGEQFIRDFTATYRGLALHNNMGFPMLYNTNSIKIAAQNILTTKPGISTGVITPLTKIKLLSEKLIITNNNNVAELFENTIDFSKMEVGGLGTELMTIFRKVFASRMLPMNIIEKLDVKHVKGLVLYGPPGTGKTLIARQLSKSLKSKSITIVNGPELISSYVGASEENVRKLFIDAEADMKAKRAGLHVVVFDEFDSLCKRRGESSGVSGDVNDRIVTQLLSKIDGVDELNNILLIGMTNRIELIDPAILRPGRFEVHINIGLPDESGRVEILKIHTNKLFANNCISPDVKLEDLAHRTKNYTGAELEGLVRDARSYAINTIVNIEDPKKPIDIKDILITASHFNKSIDSYVPKFGQSIDDLNYYLTPGITIWDNISNLSNEIVSYIPTHLSTENLVSIGILGGVKTGKTILSILVGQELNYPYTKVISNNDMIGFSETAKIMYIRDVFEQAYNSELSVIIIDNLETILEYYKDEYNMRVMFSLLNSFKTLITKRPRNNQHKLVVILNSSIRIGNIYDVIDNTTIITG
jgi:vesicle-fusing ATPase